MLTRAILHLALSLWLLRQLEQVRLHCFLWLSLAYQLPLLHLCWSAFPSMFSPSVLCKLPEVFTISSFPLWSTNIQKHMLRKIYYGFRTKAAQITISATALLHLGLLLLTMAIFFPERGQCEMLLNHSIVFFFSLLIWALPSSGLNTRSTVHVKQQWCAAQFSTLGAQQSM